MLFYITPKGTNIPITTVKGYTPTHVTLLSGERIPDEDPQFKQLHGTEDIELQALYTTLSNVVKEMDRVRQHTVTLNNKTLDSLNNLTKKVNLQLEETCDTIREMRGATNQTLTDVSDASRAMRSGSEQIRKLGETVNATLRELEEAIAASGTI